MRLKATGDIFPFEAGKTYDLPTPYNSFGAATVLAEAIVVHDDMRPEYDFASMAGGVRGKYSKAYRAGHAVKIHQADGTTTVQYFTLEDGAVLLEPDVREYFPDSESVNRALRALIALFPRRREAMVKTQ